VHASKANNPPEPLPMKDTMKKFLTLLTAAIGKAVESPEVKALFANQKIAEQLSVGNDNYETYIERPLLGYSFNIIEREFIENQLYSESRNKTLILRGCHFHSEGHENYSEYKGLPPYGINFEDSRETAIKKLGDSAWQYKKDRMVRRERWELAETDRQLNLTYSNDQSSIKVIYFGIREFFTN
jgi:hypothetical protein